MVGIVRQFRLKTMERREKVRLMEKPPSLLQKAAGLRDKAGKARRLAIGLGQADNARLTQYSEELTKQATELERQAAAATPARPAEPSRDTTKDEHKQKKGRGGSNDPEPQA